MPFLPPRKCPAFVKPSTTRITKRDKEDKEKKKQVKQLEEEQKEMLRPEGT
jgi:hypothetical protein